MPKPMTGVSRDGHLWEAGRSVEAIGKMHFRVEDPLGYDRQHEPMHIMEGIGMVWGAIRNPFPKLDREFRLIKETGAGVSNYNLYDRRIANRTDEWLKEHADKDEGPWEVGLAALHPPFIWALDKVPIMKFLPRRSSSAARFYLAMTQVGFILDIQTDAYHGRHSTWCADAVICSRTYPTASSAATQLSRDDIITSKPNITPSPTITFADGYMLRKANTSTTTSDSRNCTISRPTQKSCRLVEMEKSLCERLDPASMLKRSGASRPYRTPRRSRS